MGSGSTPEGNSARPHHQPPQQDLRPTQAKRPRTEVDETTETASAKARIRVTRACDECRRRKDRCDGQRPSCQPCLAAKRTCAYNPSKKRGLRIGYVRSLEILFGFLIGTVDGMEPWACSVLEGDAPSPKLHLRPPTDKVDDAAEFAMSTWRKSDVLKKLESVLSSTESQDDEDESSEGLKRRLAQALEKIDSLQESPDGTGAQGPNRLPISPMDTDSTSPMVLHPPPSSSGVPQHQSAHATNAMAPAAAFYEGLDLPPQEIQETGQQKLPPNWSYLLDIYFSNTHCWFPISRKQDLLRTAYTLANTETQNVTSPYGGGDEAFLWAALAYSSNQSDNIESIRGQTPQIQGLTKKLHDNAKRLATLEAGGYEMGHVRALLILTLFEISRGSWSTAWVTIGKAVYVSSSLNLINPIVQTAVRLEEGIKRSLLGCIALETLLAAKVHSRPYFRRSDIQRIGPLETDGIEEWEPWQPRLSGGQHMPSSGIPGQQGPGQVLSLFSQFIDTMGLVNDLLVGQNVGTNDASLRQTEQILRRWKQTVSSRDGDPSNSEVPPQVLNLRLAFDYVVQVISSQEFPIRDPQINHSATDRWDYTRQLSNALKTRVQSVEALWIPPATPIYLSLFNESLEACRNPLGNSLLEDYRRLCQDSLSEMEQTWWNIKNGSAFNFSNFQDQNFSGEYEQQPPQTPHSLVQRMGMRIASLTPLGSDHPFTGQNIASQTGMASSVSNTAIKDSRNVGSVRLDDQQVVGNATFPGQNETAAGSRSSKEVGLDQFPDDLMGTMGDDELFDSLATLDPTDWVANPSDFMRHLGVPHDASTDIQSLFNADPT